MSRWEIQRSDYGVGGFLPGYCVNSGINCVTLSRRSETLGFWIGCVIVIGFDLPFSSIEPSILTASDRIWNWEGMGRKLRYPSSQSQFPRKAVETPDLECVFSSSLRLLTAIKALGLGLYPINHRSVQSNIVFLLISPNRNFGWRYCSWTFTEPA
jgi:hypothetical protein